MLPLLLEKWKEGFEVVQKTIRVNTEGYLGLRPLLLVYSIN